MATSSSLILAGSFIAVSEENVLHVYSRTMKRLRSLRPTEEKIILVFVVPRNTAMTMTTLEEGSGAGSGSFFKNKKQSGGVKLICVVDQLGTIVLVNCETWKQEYFGKVSIQSSSEGGAGAKGRKKSQLQIKKMNREDAHDDFGNNEIFEIAQHYFIPFTTRDGLFQEGELHLVLVSSISGIFDFNMATSETILLFPRPLGIRDYLLSVGEYSGLIVCAQRRQRWLKVVDFATRHSAISSMVSSGDPSLSTNQGGGNAGIPIQQISFHRHFEVCSIAAHPTEPSCVALGSMRGEFMLFRNILQSAQQQSQQSGHYFADHWHHTPLTALSFSKDGSYVMTGASESVLLLWRLSDCSYSKVVCRLGAIHSISQSSGGEMGEGGISEGGEVLLQVSESTLAVVDLVQRRVDRSCDGVQWSNVNPCRGLVSASWFGQECFVLTGLAEAVKFYDPKHRETIYSLHVSHAMEALPNPPSCGVHQVCLIDDGAILVTYEVFDSFALPSLLRWWKYDSGKKIHVETQCVVNPHGEASNNLTIHSDINRDSFFEGATEKNEKEKVEAGNDLETTPQVNQKELRSMHYNEQKHCLITCSAEAIQCWAPLSDNIQVQVDSVQGLKSKGKWLHVSSAPTTAMNSLKRGGEGDMKRSSKDGADMALQAAFQQHCNVTAFPTTLSEGLQGTTLSADGNVMFAATDTVFCFDISHCTTDIGAKWPQLVNFYQSQTTESLSGLHISGEEGGGSSPRLIGYTSRFVFLWSLKNAQLLRWIRFGACDHEVLPRSMPCMAAGTPTAVGCMIDSQQSLLLTFEGEIMETSAYEGDEEEEIMGGSTSASKKKQQVTKKDKTATNAHTVTSSKRGAGTPKRYMKKYSVITLEEVASLVLSPVQYAVLRMHPMVQETTSALQQKDNNNSNAIVQLALVCAGRGLRFVQFDFSEAVMLRNKKKNEEVEEEEESRRKKKETEKEWMASSAVQETLLEEEEEGEGKLQTKKSEVLLEHYFPVTKGGGDHAEEGGAGHRQSLQDVSSSMYHVDETLLHVKNTEAKRFLKSVVGNNSYTVPPMTELLPSLLQKLDK